MREYPNIKKVLQDKLLKGEITPLPTKEKDGLIMFKLDKTTYFSLDGNEMNLLKGDYLIINKDGSVRYIFEENINKDFYKDILEKADYIDTYAIAAQVLFREKYLDEREAFIKDLILANKVFEGKEVEKILEGEERDKFEEAISIALKEKLEKEKEKEDEERTKKEIKQIKEKEKKVKVAEKEKEYYIAMLSDIVNSADFSEKEKLQDAGDRIEEAPNSPNKIHEVNKGAAETKVYDKVEESEKIVEEVKEERRTIIDVVNEEIEEYDDEDHERYEVRTKF